MSAQECRFCKHWNMTTYRCTRLSDGGAVWAVWKEGEMSPPIYTNASFGCNLFEPRLVAKTMRDSLDRVRELAEGEMWTLEQARAISAAKIERNQRRERIATEVLGRLAAARLGNFPPPSEAALKAKLMADALMAELDKA